MVLGQASLGTLRGSVPQHLVGSNWIVRIVSLLPGATESLFALGLGRSLVAVSHECDHPPEARSLPAVTRATLELGALDGGAIDAAVSQRAARGGPLYELDGRAIERLRPDLVVAQDVCQVCAVAADQVEELAPELAGARLLRHHPHRLRDVLADIEELARAAGADARPLLSGMRGRLDAVQTAVGGLERKRVVFLEWLDPPYPAGHWTPDLIELAGAYDPLALPGLPSRATGWEEVRAASPEVLVAAPCGFDQARAAAEVERMRHQIAWTRVEEVVVLDGSAYFNRAGPRLVEGVEKLAAALHGYNPSIA